MLESSKIRNFERFSNSIKGDHPVVNDLCVRCDTTPIRGECSGGVCIIA